MKALGILIFAFFVSSCTTPGVVLEESNYSIKQHRVAITAAFGLVREISQNGRMVYSMFHDRNFKNFEVTAKTKERYYTKATILGAIRPYRVSVEVIYERRDPDSKAWIMVNEDAELSQKRADVIRNMLTQSRDEGGTFDEESPF